MAVEIVGNEYSRSGSTGGTKRALITPKGRLLTYATSESTKDTASLENNAFSLLSSEITGISTADSAILFYEHKEDRPMLIDSFIMGTANVASATTQPVTILKNPTAGTIVSDANTGTVLNRNFGSSNALSNSNFYVASGNGKTFTDGTEAIFFYGSSNTRTPILDIALTLEKGSSIGVAITPSEALDLYMVFTGHLVDV